ncbi:helix-turn-helix domain-containing protein [bacterium]|nr:helix-turn-helix domain-containing protein [bacterium]NUN45193.1 helix-turn-helix domain-containing protein [bacterium]
MKNEKYDTTREFVTTLSEIIAQPGHHVLDKIVSICSRLRGTYVPSAKYVLRQSAIHRVIDLHHQGKSVREITASVGLKKSTVYKILKEHHFNVCTLKKRNAGTVTA